MSTFGQRFAEYVRARLTELGLNSLGKVQAYQLAAWLDSFHAEETKQGELNLDHGLPEQIHKTQDAKRDSDLANPPISKPDLVFEAVAGVCGVRWTELTPSARKPLNSAVSQLKSVGATPDEIRRRALRFQARYPTATLRPTALCRHWPELANKDEDVIDIKDPGPRLIFEPANWQEFARATYRDEAGELESWAASAISLGWKSMTHGMRAKIAREYQPPGERAQNL